MKRTTATAIGIALVAGLAACTNSGISDNAEPPLKQESQAQQASGSCDKPSAVFKNKDTQSPEILRVDKFEDPQNFDVAYEREAISSLRWSPSPKWANMQDVMNAVNDVSPQSVDERNHEVPDSSTLTITSDKQSINYLSYFASSPTSYDFIVSCLNDQETEFKLRYSTWTLDESGLLDCSLQLQADAPKVAGEVIKKYC